MRIRLAMAPALCVVMIALGLSSCGGDSGSGATAVPPAPVTTVVAEGSGTVSAPSCNVSIVGGNLVITCGGTARTQLLPSFSTTAGGRLEFVLDWTSPSNDLDAALRQGSTEVGRTTSGTTKPERLRVENMPAGTYTPVVMNFGPGQESFSYQVLLTH